MSGVVWRKSSHSGSSGGECVEVALLDGVNAMRDSKDRDGDVLYLGRGVWEEMMSQIKRGAYDL
nr:DUF397 domain-containing protein [Actinomadura bangladeshensis]